MFNRRTSSKSGSSRNSAQPKINNRGLIEKVQVRKEIKLRMEGKIEDNRSLTIRKNRKNIVHLITKRIIKVERESVLAILLVRGLLEEVTLMSIRLED